MTNGKLITGIVLLVALIVLAVSGPMLGRMLFPNEDPLAIAAYRPLMMPDATHWIGTNHDGNDALVVFLNSIMPSLLIGLTAGVIATVIGVTIAFVAGYSGGRIDAVLRTFTDMVLVIPSLPIFLALGLYIPRWNIFTIGLLIGAFAWPFTARVIRAQVLSLRERSYVDLARISGENDLEIIFLELLPALLPYIGLTLSASIVGAMLVEAGLQFVGFGAGGLSTLGYMIGQGFRRGLIGVGLYGQMLLPAAVLVLMFLSLNLINMGLEEMYNPRLRTTVQDK